VSGPIVVSFSEHDTAVGIAYPLASRIARDAARAIGDARDPFGGMGRNGAQHMTNDVRQVDMLPVGGHYTDLGKDIVCNVHAEAFISSHSDVRGPECTELLAQTIASTP
jgi:hypothetical protein